MFLARAAAPLAAATVALLSLSPSAAAASGGVIRAGTPFTTDSSAQCTTGFAAAHDSLGDGFLAAGNCGVVGDRAYVDGAAVGTVRLADAAGLTWLWVELDDGWTASGELADGSVISDDSEAPVGASVCRVGSATSWHCGTIQAEDETISFPQGTVTGVTRTDVCGDPDDDGPFVSGSSAQGVPLGDPSGCSSGGASYFYPLTRVLAEAGSLSLITTAR